MLTGIGLNMPDGVQSKCDLTLLYEDVSEVDLVKCILRYIVRTLTKIY